MTWLKRLILCNVLHEHKYEMYGHVESGGRWETIMECRLCGRRLYY